MNETRYAGSFTVISDPEFWDITEGRAHLAETALSQQALSYANGRPVLLFAGHVEAGRGINLLADLAEAGISPAIVVCGKVLADADDAVRRLSAAGAMVEARFVSDDELLSMIRAATYVWCCFPPERDMSSGLFGRAMQLGAMPVVRRGSVLDAMAEHLIPTLVLDFSDVAAAKQAFSNPPPARVVFDGTRRLREDARHKLLAALQ